MKKMTYVLKRLRDGKVFRKKIEESWMMENMDVLRQVVIKGDLYQRLVADELAEEGGLTQGEKSHGRLSATYPMKSDAAGIHPSQIPEAREHFAKMGIKVDYTRDGRAIFESPGHRKQVCEAMGLYDRNGGYSDPQPQSGRKMY